MNHTRNAIRFAVVVFWLVILGMALGLDKMGTNLLSLGYPTLLFYGVVATVIVYGGAVISKRLWNAV